MSERTHTLLRGSVRATVGVLVIGVAATAAVLLTTWPLPSIERAPVAVAVDTLHGAEQTLVCPGSFSELGADPTRPGTAIPVGGSAIIQAGNITDLGELQRAELSGSLPTVLRAGAGDIAAAAQTQAVTTATLRGVTAAACAEPVHEQWIVGGSTALGASTTLSLGNPTDVPATVQIRLYDQNGEVDQGNTTGVLVPAQSERTVSLNGYAPARERLVVKITSTGAAVTASVGIGQVISLTPFAVDTVTRQLGPTTEQIIPGVVNISDHEHGGPGDAGELDPYSVVVRLLAPGGESGTATIRALQADGTSLELGQAEFGESAVTDFPIQHWPEDANGMIITSDAPVVAGVQASSDNGVDHDYAWFAPAPLMAADTEFAAPIAVGGQLVLVNPGATEAKVKISDASGAAGDREIVVPAGAALPVTASGGAVLTSTEPIAAGVRVTSGGIGAYPILAPVERTSELMIYPR